MTSKKYIVQWKEPRNGMVGRSKLPQSVPLDEKEAAAEFHRLRALGYPVRFVAVFTLEATEVLEWNVLPDWRGQRKADPAAATTQRSLFGGGAMMARDLVAHVG